VAPAAGAVNPSIAQQQRQQRAQQRAQLIKQYLEFDLPVRLACAASPDALAQLNHMREVGLACITAALQQQQQQQEGEDTKQQPLLVFLTAERAVAQYCAGTQQLLRHSAA
jgi:hypothetical protein